MENNSLKNTKKGSDKPKFKVREVSVDELEEAKKEEVEEVTEDPASTEMSKKDYCPQCGHFAIGGAIQVRLPLPQPDGKVAIISLPLLICVGCTNAYMPRTFLEQALRPQPESDIEVPEEPRIVVP